ncbi:hypothetical protein MNBD_GAMMA11-693, partial [hydrothermal vent metagenome]
MNKAILAASTSLALLASCPAYSIPVNFDATNGTWIISATDISGLTWDGSTLNF